MKFHKKCIFLGYFFIQLSQITLVWSDDLSEAENQAMTKEQIETLKSQINVVQKNVEKNQGKQSQLEKELKETEVKIGQIFRQVTEIREEIAGLRNQLIQLNDRKATLDKEKKEQAQKLAAQIRASYVMGRQAYVKLLLNQEDPHVLSRVLKYYAYFNQTRMEKIDRYRALLDELITLEQTIAEQQGKLTIKENQFSIEQKNLQDAQNARKTTIAKLEAEIASQKKQLDQLAKDKDQFENLLTGVRHVVETVKVPGKFGPFAKQKGKLSWPVKGKITKQFGKKADNAVSENGILISAQSGSQVKSIYSGRVVFADWMRSFGLMIIIDHGGGYMSLYAQNDSLLKETGSWVDQGESIAVVGKSGGRSKSALYFEIRRNGKPANPANWILAMK